ncbi:hypothetical protein AVEN_125050-1 [Araneus ventricosus]|uniref:Uncharacterized protein n=1 Tax=Araneus ventricosus TaxID=182803 RepID=A0A4Y2GRX6_ARAVE|nr:hypothetical protein AVEN_125050-1 [Araneus ventricosus]
MNIASVAANSERTLEYLHRTFVENQLLHRIKDVFQLLVVLRFAVMSRPAAKEYWIPKINRLCVSRMHEFASFLQEHAWAVSNNREREGAARHTGQSQVRRMKFCQVVQSRTRFFST